MGDLSEITNTGPVMKSDEIAKIARIQWTLKVCIFSWKFICWFFHSSVAH